MNKRNKSALLFALLLFSGLSAMRASAQSMRSLTVFQAGDAVQIQIWELYREEETGLNLSRDYAITSDGYIVMPILGEVKVIGLTAYELMQQLEEKFSAYLRNPFVYVRPLIRLILQGEFARPGAYRPDPSSSLWDVVALAGGPTSECNLSRMRVERGGEVVIRDLLNSFEKGYSMEEIGIESGDQIIAPAKSQLSFAFFVTLINLSTSLLLLYLRLKTGRW